MNSLEGIIAANRHAERTQALNRATNNPAGARDDSKAIKTAVHRARQSALPKRDASGRLAR